MARGNRRAGQQQGQNRRETEDQTSPWLPPWVKWTSIIIALCSIVWYLKFRPAVVVPLRSSQVIDTYIRMMVSLSQNVEMLEEIDREDPLVYLIRENMRPIQDRIASLRTQTSQYEKMERIPGGPQHFISTTVAELDDMANIKIPYLDIIVAKEISYTRSVANTMQNLRREIRDIYTNHLYIIDSLAKEGVILNVGRNVVDYDVKQYRDKDKPHGTNPILILLVEKLQILQKLFEAREIIYEKAIAELERFAGGAAIVDNLGDDIPEFLANVVLFYETRPSEKVELIESYRKLAQRIRDEIEENKGLYNLIEPLNTEGMGRLNSLSEKLGKEDRQKPSAALKSQIQTDLVNLRLRVESLQ